MLVAHRGIHNNIDIPENSLLAFKKALELNTAIELDIRLTKDNELVVFHDNNLKRMTGINSCIEDLSLHEIKKIKLNNTDEDIPTLKEVFTLIQGKVLIDIEIKNTVRINEVAEKLIELLHSYDGDVMIKSFNPKIIRKLRKINSSYKYGLLIADKYDTRFQSIIMKSNLILYYCKPNFLAISKKLSKTKRFINLRKKYPIYIWTIKSIDEINIYKEYGDHYICNNLPY